MDKETYEALSRVMRRRREGEREKRREYLEASRERLKANVRRKVTASFVSALEAFERHFGHLWGDGKDVSALSPKQLSWRAEWLKARDEILSKGNAQVRAAESEVAEYTVHWDRKCYDFDVRSMS